MDRLEVFSHVLSFTAALSGQTSEAKIVQRGWRIQRKTHFFSVFDITKEISNNMMQSSYEADGLAIPAQDCAAHGGESFAPCRAPVARSPPTLCRTLVCSKTSLGASRCGGGRGVEALLIICQVC